MNYLSIEQLAKSYGVKELFGGLTYGINKGQKVALIARNGTGKSTLLRILAGKEKPDKGEFTFRNGIRIGYLEQSPQFNGDETVIDAVFDTTHPMAVAVKQYEHCLVQNAGGEEMQAAIDKMDELKAWDHDVKVRRLLSQLQIDDLQQPVSALSGGQQKRLALARLLSEEPDFLLLDEPTNHLDVEMIEWLENYLSGRPFTIFMVTHDRYFLDAVCNEILELDGGEWHKYTGKYDYFIEKKAMREQVAASEVEKAKNLMRRELEWIRRQPKARGTKAKYRVDAFDEVKQKAQQGKKEEQMDMEINMRRMGSKILELHNIHKSYGGKELIKGFRYVFKKGEKIGMAGKNGTGKSTLLKIIMGEVMPDMGKAVSGETIVFGYYSQSGMALKEDKRVIEVVKDIAEVIPLLKGRKITASQMLERFLFPKEMHYSYVSALSGGERRRLYLLTILMKNPNFLILDEPTNDLDIDTLNVLEDFLSDFPGCVLVVTHDRYFMDKVVDHLLIFEGEGSIKGFNGTYGEYRLKKKEEEKKAPVPAAGKERTGGKEVEKEKKKLTYKEKLEFESLEKEIAQLEKEKERISEQLNSGITDHVELEKLGQQLSGILSRLDTKTDRWLELSELA